MEITILNKSGAKFYLKQGHLNHAQAVINASGIKEDQLITNTDAIEFSIGSLAVEHGFQDEYPESVEFYKQVMGYLKHQSAVPASDAQLQDFLDNKLNSISHVLSYLKNA